MLEARPRSHVVNIGYVLTSTQWGQGLMVEAIQAFTAIALRLPGIFRVEATCDVENRASARALEKSGFVLDSGGATRPSYRASEHLCGASGLPHLCGLPAVVTGGIRPEAIVDSWL